MEGSSLPPPPDPQPADAQPQHQQDSTPNPNFLSGLPSSFSLSTKQTSPAPPTTHHRVSTMTASKSKSNKSSSKEPRTGSGPSAQAKLDAVAPAGSQPVLENTVGSNGGKGGKKTAAPKANPGQDDGGRAGDVGAAGKTKGWQNILAQMDNRSGGSGNVAMRAGDSGDFQSIPVPQNSGKTMDQHKQGRVGKGEPPASHMARTPGPENMPKDSANGYSHGFNNGQFSMGIGQNSYRMFNPDAGSFHTIGAGQTHAGGSVFSPQGYQGCEDVVPSETCHDTAQQDEASGNFQDRSGGLRDVPEDIQEMGSRRFRYGVSEQVSTAAGLLHLTTFTDTSILYSRSLKTMVMT